MADIIIVNTSSSAPAAIEAAQTPAPQKLAAQEPTQSQKPAAEPAEPYFDLIELLFFAYRDFVGDPDEVLEKLGFGRAHHRVLHFVNRNPGMKVAELLDVLKITKQSLGRVLKQLIDEGYVVQKAGANDRRQRLLYASAAGEALAMKLAGLQALRIKRVLADLGPDTREAARRFLAGMIDAEDRERVLRLIAQADSFSGARGDGQNDMRRDTQQDAQDDVS
ncbi:MAG TPA: MarR family transcriptional regulator [Xanthobacteraceae bacterium]|jgi:DNA-binding MarR family transcriptional regulator|nr:MarR family transcriptional regulator [Xanthobacteraceae bacterium]